MVSLRTVSGPQRKPKYKENINQQLPITSLPPTRIRHYVTQNDKFVVIENANSPFSLKVIKINNINKAKTTMNLNKQQ